MEIKIQDCAVLTSSEYILQDGTKKDPIEDERFKILIKAQILETKNLKENKIKEIKKIALKKISQKPFYIVVFTPFETSYEIFKGISKIHLPGDPEWDGNENQIPDWRIDDLFDLFYFGYFDIFLIRTEDQQDILLWYDTAHIKHLKEENEKANQKK